jgi:hypothetical protein
MQQTAAGLWGVGQAARFHASATRPCCARGILLRQQPSHTERHARGSRRPTRAPVSPRRRAGRAARTVDLLECRAASMRSRRPATVHHRQRHAQRLRFGQPHSARVAEQRDLLHRRRQQRGCLRYAAHDSRRRAAGGRDPAKRGDERELLPTPTTPIRMSPLLVHRGTCASLANLFGPGECAQSASIASCSRDENAACFGSSRDPPAASRSTWAGDSVRRTEGRMTLAYSGASLVSPPRVAITHAPY